VAFLKIHTMAPKCGSQRQQAEHDGLDRYQDAAKHGEQQHDRGQGDDGQGQGQPVVDGVGVHQLGRAAFDPERERRVQGPEVLDQALTLGRAQGHRGDDVQPRAGLGGLHGHSAETDLAGRHADSCGARVTEHVVSEKPIQEAARDLIIRCDREIEPT
jgi:hypothetical protein